MQHFVSKCLRLDPATRGTAELMLQVCLILFFFDSFFHFINIIIKIARVVAKCLSKARYNKIINCTHYFK